jgi:hypothetical protein
MITLMSEDFKRAVASQSRVMQFIAKTQTKHNTLVDFKITRGHRRYNALKHSGVPGWLLCAWMMDKNITNYWKPNAEVLATYLGLPLSQAFDTED